MRADFRRDPSMPDTLRGKAAGALLLRPGAFR
jgi:hypothetical protein